jgi:glycosyltransferase involved in cell wall biosynthesis
MNNSTKGIPLLLEAFALLKRQGTDCDLIIVGQGRDRDALRTLAGRLHLDADRVLVGGLPESELDELYSEAHVYVSMSSQESFGISVMKAIAHRCRLVVSDIPSHREIVTTLGVPAHGLVPVDSAPEVVAAAISAQLVAPILHESVTQSVPTWVESAKLLAAAYQEILEPTVAPTG